MAGDFGDSLRDRLRLTKENTTLVKKNEEAGRERQRLLVKLQQLREANATLKKDVENNYNKRKICERESRQHKKEVDELRAANSELRKDAELRIHNAMEKHIGNFLKSRIFEDIINLYQLPIAILAFTEFRKKVKA